jgi:pimeloyl-ACP methyl ester carboxylesterase
MAVLDFGPPQRPVDLVFSHATGFNARTYRTILAPLAAELRILAPDYRGHGASRLPADPEAWPGWQGFADDLLALLEAQADRPVVLAGHSMGATSSLLAAAAAPARVRALVLFEPVLMNRPPDGEAIWRSPLVQGARQRRDVFPSRAVALAAYRGRGVFAGWSKAQVADYVEAGFDEAPDGGVALACRPEWEAATFAIHGYDPWAALEQAACPVSLYAAGRGSCVGSRAREFADAGRVRFETIPEASHMLPQEQPALVQAALREAVARV